MSDERDPDDAGGHRFSFIVAGTGERRDRIVRIAAIGAAVVALIGAGLGIGLAITARGSTSEAAAAGPPDASRPGSLGGGFGTTIELPPYDGSGDSVQPAQPAPLAPTGPGAATPLPHSPPTRIWIPSIGVSSSLVRLGLQSDRSLEVPSDFAVAGWWAGGPSPGEDGSAVIAGHVDSRSGPAVFFELRRLRRGDAIWVKREDGTEVRFVVQRLEQVPKTRFPTHEVYGPQPYAALRLITCGGAFDRSTGHYVDNVIVFASAAR